MSGEIPERLAVVESEHKMLASDFQRSRQNTDELLTKIFDKVDEIPVTIIRTVTECKDVLEQDINDTYMTKEAGLLLQQNIKSIKAWIATSVSIATSTFIFAMWLLNIKII